jgi:hypothetical protein
VGKKNVSSQRHLATFSFNFFKQKTKNNNPNKKMRWKTQQVVDDFSSSISFHSFSVSFWVGP